MDDNSRTGELRRKLEKDPGSRLFGQLAEELRKEGKLDEAIAVARKGLEKNPNYPSARLTLARALLDSGRPGEARPELEQIVKASPDNIMASRLLGDALLAQGETARALQQFERTLLISPGDKVVVERISELKASLLVAAPTAPGPPAVASRFVSFPSVETPREAPTVQFEPAPRQSPAAVPLVVAPPAPAVPGQAPVALDRDLASGTLSPGSLTVSGLQEHFDASAEQSSDDLTAAPALDATVGFGEMERSALEAPPEAAAAVAVSATAPSAPQEFPAVELPADEPDPGGQTIPLTSMTLADLYLQQGLKAEASAVLSQVIKEEPENAEAKSRFASVSTELAATGPVTAALPSPPEAPPAPSRASLTGAEVRERTIMSLKAFASAAEREAVRQRATERGAF